MLSQNVSSAENQQESQFLKGWIVGIVDGEGCFSVSVLKNATTANGFQIFPEFVVTQGEKSLSSLKTIQKFFGCGNIFVNRRKDNHNENLYRFCVRSVKDLSEKIIPFFENNSLKTAKAKDFQIFKAVVERMKKGKHLTKNGFMSILKKISKMNRQKIRN